MATDRRTYNGM